MSKLCPTCDNPVDDGVFFCPACGQRVSPPPKWTKLIFFVSMALIIAIVLGIVLFDNSYAKPIENHITVILDGTLEDVEAMAPMRYWRDSCHRYTGKTAEQYQQHVLNAAAAQGEALKEEYGKNVSISFYVKEKTAFKREDHEAAALAFAAQYNIPIKQVKKMYDLTIKYTIKGSKGKDSDLAYCSVVKIYSNWYLFTYVEDEWGNYQVYFLVESQYSSIQ